eukprot:3273132-Pyramimonas_sp.AAC.1
MHYLRALDIPADLIVALVDAMTDNQCVASFEGIKASSAVCWDKSIRTGGVEGPMLFLAVSIVLWRDVIERWRQDTQYGIKLENDEHALRARVDETRHQHPADECRDDLEAEIFDVYYFGAPHPVIPRAGYVCAGAVSRSCSWGSRGDSAAGAVV